MNTAFRDYTRQSAFVLTLSAGAIQQILDMHYGDEDCRKAGRNPDDYGTQGSLLPLGYLLRRGLIKQLPRQSEESIYGLTEAGTLMAKLLEEAGYKSTLRGTMFQEVLTAQ